MEAVRGMVWIFSGIAHCFEHPAVLINANFRGKAKCSFCLFMS